RKPLRVFGELRLDRASNHRIRGSDVGRETRNDIALAIDDELFEVPCDLGLGLRSQTMLIEGLAQRAIGLTLGFRHGANQVLIEWMLSFALNHDFLEHGELDAELGLAKLLYFGIRAGLLSGKLIGRKTKHLESLAMVSLVD